MAENNNFIKNLFGIKKNHTEKNANNLENSQDSKILSQKNNNTDSDSTPNFIKLDDQFSQQNSPQNSINKNSHQEFESKINGDDKKRLDDAIETLRKTNVKPLSNQQRNLDREEGGLELENHETEAHLIDEWDNRNEEIIKMGENINPNFSSGKKSMLWNLKRKKLQEKKNNEEIADIKGDLKQIKIDENYQDGVRFDSSKQQSLTQRINALRKDRIDINDPTKTR